MRWRETGIVLTARAWATLEMHQLQVQLGGSALIPTKAPRALLSVAFQPVVKDTC